MSDKAGLLFKQFGEWSKFQHQIKGVAIVGSYARGDNTPNSDIDLVIISTDKEVTLRMIRTGFQYNEIMTYSFEEWGILTSLRIFYQNGLEVEYGVVTEQWVQEPLDEGTKYVVKMG